jgi:hypothetical protein
MKKLTVVVGGIALAGLAACSRSYTVEVGSTSLPPAAGQSAAAQPAAAAPAQTSSGDSFAVSCKMATGPVNSFTGNPSLIPEISVKNTGSSTLALPDMAASNSAISFDVKFMNTSGGLVTEDQSMLPNQDSATIAPGASFTFTPIQNNGVVNDDEAGDGVTACTATMVGGQ